MKAWIFFVLQEQIEYKCIFLWENSLRQHSHAVFGPPYGAGKSLAKSEKSSKLVENCLVMDFNYGFLVMDFKKYLMVSFQRGLLWGTTL